MTYSAPQENTLRDSSRDNRSPTVVREGSPSPTPLRGSSESDSLPMPNPSLRTRKRRESSCDASSGWRSWPWARPGSSTSCGSRQSRRRDKQFRIANNGAESPRPHDRFVHREEGVRAIGDDSGPWSCRSSTRLCLPLPACAAATRRLRRVSRRVIVLRHEVAVLQAGRPTAPRPFGVPLPMTPCSKVAFADQSSESVRSTNPARPTERD
jgi:hypothetical protein